MQILGEENPLRHKPGTNKLRPPRPLGVATGVPWEPRKSERSPAFQNITVEFLEFLDRAPKLQTIAARMIGAIFSGATKHDSPLPDDVADERGAWKFSAIGDYGAGTEHQARVAANMIRSRPELIITAGDNVYPTGRWSDYAAHWDPDRFMGEIGRRVPFMPSLGNHDMYLDDLRPYFGHFPHLKGKPYYSFVHRNAQFLALDSDQDLRVGSSQYRWLERELSESTSRWRVVYLHYPLFGRDPDAFKEIRTAIQPLLARYGVQVLVAGHEHNYQRSQVIDGVTHILTGGGGQQVFPFTKRQPDHIARRVAAFEHVDFSVGTNSIVVRAIDEFGARIDTAVIPWHGIAAGQAATGAAHAVRVSPRVPGRRRRRRTPAPSTIAFPQVKTGLVPRDLLNHR